MNPFVFFIEHETTNDGTELIGNDSNENNRRCIVVDIESRTLRVSSTSAGANDEVAFFVHVDEAQVSENTINSDLIVIPDNDVRGTKSLWWRNMPVGVDWLCLNDLIEEIDVLLTNSMKFFHDSCVQKRARIS